MNFNQDEYADGLDQYAKTYPAHYFACCIDKESLLNEMHKPGFDVNRQDCCGVTVLMYIVSKWKDPEFSQMFSELVINWSADPHLKNLRGHDCSDLMNLRYRYEDNL